MNVSRQEFDVRVSRRAAIRWFTTVTVMTLFAMSIVAGTLSGSVVTLAVLTGLGWIGYRLYKLVEFLMSSMAGCHRRTTRSPRGTAGSPRPRPSTTEWRPL